MYKGSRTIQVLAGGGGGEDDPNAEKELYLGLGLFMKVETYSYFEVEIEQQGARTPLAGEYARSRPPLKTEQKFFLKN
jgi:hypothetical protein